MPANADRADAVVSLAGPLDLKEIIDVGFSRFGNLVVAKNLATFLNCRAATACDCFDDPTCGIHDACPVPGPNDFVPPAFASVARHLDASDPPIYAAFLPRML
jgi:hypothetical protein